jgi:hypothetical protein
MTSEEVLHSRVKSRFIDYLKASGQPFYPPALTICPCCGEQAGIMMDTWWSCTHCGRRGDAVDYVMACDHYETPMGAIRKICHVLHIKITELEVMSANDLMDMQLVGGEYLVEKLIGKGLYILAGPPKTGKSWLVLWLAHCVSLGLPVWQFKTQKCEVLYVSLEDPRQRIQKRLAEVTGGDTGQIWIATEAELIGTGFDEQLANFLSDYPNVKFVIIDTLQKVRQMMDCSYAGDYDAVSHIKMIADRFGVSILLVHHTRKAGASDPLQMISGTTGLSGCADGVMVIQKKLRQETEAELFVTGRDTIDMQMQLQFDSAAKIWDFIGYSNPEKTEKKARLLSAVYELITEIKTFDGTPTELLKLLQERGENSVSKPNALTRLLNPNTEILRHDYGIAYRSDDRGGGVRKVHLKLMPVVEVDGTVVEDGSDDSADNASPDDTVTIVTMALTSGEKTSRRKGDFE